MSPPNCSTGMFDSVIYLSTDRKKRANADSKHVEGNYRRQHDAVDSRRLLLFSLFHEPQADDCGDQSHRDHAKGTDLNQIG